MAGTPAGNRAGSFEKEIGQSLEQLPKGPDTQLFFYEKCFLPKTEASQFADLKMPLGKRPERKDFIDI